MLNKKSNTFIHDRGISQTGGWKRELFKKSMLFTFLSWKITANQQVRPSLPMELYCKLCFYVNWIFEDWMELTGILDRFLNPNREGFEQTTSDLVVNFYW